MSACRYVCDYIRSSSDNGVAVTVIAVIETMEAFVVSLWSQHGSKSHIGNDNDGNDQLLRSQ